MAEPDGNLYPPLDAGDLDPDPIVQFGRWYDDVVAAGLPEPGAVVLSTAGADGRPRARHVLLRGFDERGFVWHTNYESRKGRDLAENPWACLTFPWFPIRRQVVVTGTVERISAEESDAYFASRDRGNQISAWASEQSTEIPDRVFLEGRVAELEERYAGADVPRPPHWGGYRLAPDMIELWQGRINRLHDRLRYERAGGGVRGGWHITRLSP
jgi:pyridoxamine 5'-phosphate oxidase